MGEKEYDVAWLEEMRHDERVADFARAFREADCVEVLLKVACQPEDVLRALEDEERRARIAFEDTLTASGLIKRAKVAFESVVLGEEEEEPGEECVSAILVWLVPSGPWEDFAYWKEDGARKRRGVVVAMARALEEAFGVDTGSPFFASQMETTAEMLSLAHDFPFLLSSLGHTDWCEIATLDGEEVFEDIIERCNCTLETYRRYYDNSAWHSLVDMPHSGYSRGMEPFFKDERTLADNYRQLEEDLAAFRASYRGEKKYAVNFSVVALRPSFAFLAEPGHEDTVASLEQSLVSAGFCESASFSVETISDVVIGTHCNVRAVVYAQDKEDARDMPFAFRKAIVGAFREACWCWVVDIQWKRFPDVISI